MQCHRDDLTPEQRRTRVAAILAAAVVRLRVSCRPARCRDRFPGGKTTGICLELP